MEEELTKVRKVSDDSADKSINACPEKTAIIDSIEETSVTNESQEAVCEVEGLLSVYSILLEEESLVDGVELMGSEWD